MSETKDTIITSVKQHITKCGGNYADWYVGIATDARDRLFNDHNVSEKNDAWIIISAQSSAAAREIEEYFIRILGADGGTGGGSTSTTIVYAYKKTASSVE